jgi:CRISP-associated protein Cas1
LGNLHYGEDKKPYLAFDLMEEFRSPIVDTLVMKLINSSTFKLDDFETIPTTGGVYLNSTARRSFFRYFENRMSEEILHPDLLSAVSYRYAIQLQVRRYKRCLLADGSKYVAFTRES